MSPDCHNMSCHGPIHPPVDLKIKSLLMSFKCRRPSIRRKKSKPLSIFLQKGFKEGVDSDNDVYFGQPGPKK